MVDLDVLSAIEKLYELYGFVKSEHQEKYIVFTYSNGYFYNAEILYFDQKQRELELLKREYEELGYSVRDIQYTTLDELHERLFRGFFNIKIINSKLKKEYIGFCELQSKKLFNTTYEYVEPSYFWNNEVRQGNLSESILKQLDENSAQLIIVEAAAGFGKTCTSYELIKHISNKENVKYAPIFTELSKNRKASIFRYVLLDEIDKRFTSLSSKLVISEIKDGNVPLIVDGFDELISRSNKNMGDSDLTQEEESQTMLDTIAELFTEGSKTKVVLTSRKSAIFTGDIFREWVHNHLKDCNVIRISIEEPTLQEWLGYDKAEFLKNQRIPFASINNPIMLAFMRSMTMENFKAECANAENVIKYYFNSILERERERQSLQLTISEQYALLKNIAKNFVEYDIVAEEISFIRDLFLEEIDKKFPVYRERYLALEERPTEEEFATKLAGHALLNRVSPTQNYIGFINDFVFGIFIGENLIESVELLNIVDAKYIDIACTAFASRNIENKYNLMKCIRSRLGSLNYEQQISIEIKLLSTIGHDYWQHYFSNYSFNTDVFFDGNYKFINCTFQNCVFYECIIMTSAFQECSFYDCKFYNVTILRDTVNNCRLIFSDNCIGAEEFIKEAMYEMQEAIQVIDYEKEIMKKFWKAGGRYSKGRLPEMLLLKSMTPEERQGLEDALESLKKRGCLTKEGHYWFVNMDEIGQIKEILES